jgi:hypothetical protein
MPDRALRSYVSPCPAGTTLAAENVGGWEALSSEGNRAARTSAGVGSGAVFHGNLAARTSAGVGEEAASEAESPDEGRSDAGAADCSDPARRRFAPTIVRATNAVTTRQPNAALPAVAKAWCTCIPEGALTARAVVDRQTSTKRPLQQSLP